MPVHSHPVSRRRLDTQTARENSFTDSEGRSLTPDMEDPFLDAIPHSHSPTSRSQSDHVADSRQKLSPRYPTSSSKRSQQFTAIDSTSSRLAWSSATPKDRFRAAVRKIIIMHKSATSFAKPRTDVGAEPGVDPRRASADALYSGIRQDCDIEVIDYSAVRCSIRHMTNGEFSSLMQNPDSSKKEAWVKVRWINIGGLSWDVIKTLSIKYGKWLRSVYP